MTRRPPPAAAVWAVLLVVPLSLGLGASPPAHAGAVEDGHALLERAATASRDVPHRGEILWVTEEGGRTESTMVTVTATPRDLTVATDEQRLTVSARGGGFVDRASGWFIPLPSGRRPGPTTGVSVEDKYVVEAVGEDHLLDRPAARLEIRRRDTGALRERLWVDREVGLLLRRECYDDGELQRHAVFVGLEFGAEAAGGEDGARVPLEQRRQGVEEVGARHLRILSEAGWSVPTDLPDGYHRAAAFVVDQSGSSPLQQVFDDGLYRVSVFEQRGAPDVGSLPDGAEVTVDEELGKVHEWPGAVPRRLVWEASGSTFSMVGDAPRGELLAIARALPAGEPPPSRRPLQRVADGLAKLWSWTPWSG